MAASNNGKKSALHYVVLAVIIAACVGVIASARAIDSELIASDYLIVEQGGAS